MVRAAKNVIGNARFHAETAGWRAGDVEHAEVRKFSFASFHESFTLTSKLHTRSHKRISYNFLRWADGATGAPPAYMIESFIRLRLFEPEDKSLRLIVCRKLGVCVQKAPNLYRRLKAAEGPVVCLPANMAAGSPPSARRLCLGYEQPRSNQQLIPLPAPAPARPSGDGSEPGAVVRSPWTCGQ